MEQVKKFIKKLKEFGETASTLFYTDRIRSAFYSLPLLVQWVPALTWEKSDKIIRASRRSMLLSICFTLAVLILFILYSFILTFFPASYYWVQWAAVILHGILALIYLTISVILAMMEFKSRPIEIPALDRSADRLYHLMES